MFYFIFYEIIGKIIHFGVAKLKT